MPTKEVKTTVNTVIGGYDFSQDSVLVAGCGISGRSVAEVLRDHGVRVISVDECNPHADLDSFDRVSWDTITLVVTSPGFPPRSAFLQEASRRGIPVWSEIEFAWRTRAVRGSAVQNAAAAQNMDAQEAATPAQAGTPAPWIGITGTNGKTTTTEMTAAIMKVAGRVYPAVGNIGEPVSLAVQNPESEGFCVELSSFALHFTQTMELDVAVWMNVAADHLDWHGGFDNYAADKSRVFKHARRAIIFNADDPVVAGYAADAEVAQGCLKVGFTLSEPSEGQIGVADGWILDRSLLSARFPDVEQGRLVRLADLKSLSEPDGTVYPHLLTDAMAATAASLALEVPIADIRQALAAFTLDAHRIQCVETYAPVRTEAGTAPSTSAPTPIRFIDDSKATNAHAAIASLSSFKKKSVVWIAGGLAKGARFDDLVAREKPVIKAVVLIGKDPEPFTEALGAQAPEIPLTRISPDDNDSVMERAIDAAMAYAAPGDVVLMAPATASMDQFHSYEDRGDTFAQQAHQWVERHA